MSTLRLVIPALCLAAAVASLASHATAATPETPATTAAASGEGWGGNHHRRGGEFRHVLQQLNLTPDQEIQIKAIIAQAKPQLQALRTSTRQNHEALASTMPTDPNYQSLVATATSNAAARIQAASEMKSQIYAVLTPAQQSQIPALVAADQAARAARVAK